jgi:hypothetical protein
MRYRIADTLLGSVETTHLLRKSVLDRAFGIIAATPPLFVEPKVTLLRVEERHRTGQGGDVSQRPEPADQRGPSTGGMPVSLERAIVWDENSGKGLI